MPTADHARAIADAVLANTTPGTATPFAALTWGVRQAIAAEADRQGVTPEALYASQLAAVAKHQAAERSRIASANALAAAIREARR